MLLTRFHASSVPPRIALKRDRHFLDGRSRCTPPQTASKEDIIPLRAGFLKCANGNHRRWRVSYSSLPAARLTQSNMLARVIRAAREVASHRAVTLAYARQVTKRTQSTTDLFRSTISRHYLKHFEQLLSAPELKNCMQCPASRRYVRPSSRFLKRRELATT